MAFSLRKMISNIGYFKKSDEDEIEAPIDLDNSNKRRHSQLNAGDADSFVLEPAEPDSTSIPDSNIPLATSPKNFAAKKGLSDTDLVKVCSEKSRKDRSKKLKLDIKKANQSLEDFNFENIENTPKHVLLESKSSEIFSERIKLFGKTFDFESDSSLEEEDIDIESFSDEELSLASTEDKKNIKMCRKVGTESSLSLENHLMPSASPESFGDVEIDKEDHVSLLVDYQSKFEQMGNSLKKLLTDFQFHIEVAKVFNERSPGVNPPNKLSDIPKLLTDAMLDDATSPKDTFPVYIQNEEKITKYRLKKQLLEIQKTIDNFVGKYMKPDPKLTRRNTFHIHKGKRLHKSQQVTSKKKIKHYDFPDIREAMINLFAIEEKPTASTPVTDKCVCNCHESSVTDSGLTTKDDQSLSITSSIGNFSLDASALSAYSESLDQVISYTSFEETTLYATLLQKPAIERITFYVQVHSIQIKCDPNNIDSKNTISFYCPACKTTEYEENEVLKHILSQYHCEKIHFLYKTAYIKKCVASGKEIQPSTVLNPMKMYRDENKVVCFGDATYACTLCFENPIVGESVLMAHCSETEHMHRREQLSDIID